jgi:hypothetical protein
LRDHDRRAVLLPGVGAFRDAFLDALGDDYRVTYDAVPNALRLRAKIIDLKITGAGGNYEPGGKLCDEAQAAAVRRAHLFRNWLDANLAQARR